MTMKLNEKQKRIKKAKHEFSNYLFEWAKKSDLSLAEIVMIVSEQMLFLASGEVEND